MKSIPIEMALRIAQRRAAQRNYELVLPDSPYRQAVVYGLAAAHTITGNGWDFEYAKNNTSVTLPGAGPIVDMVSLIPMVGDLFASICTKLRKTTVFPSPAVMSDGGLFLAMLAHEEGHVGDIARGGVFWCAAYGAIGEVRAGGEAPCYGTGMALRAAFRGENRDELEAEAKNSLKAYGLKEGEDLAAGIIASNAEMLRLGRDPGGIIAEYQIELIREGWSS